MVDRQEQAIAEKVREYLKRYPLEGIQFAVLEDEIRNRDGFWYVPVQPDKEPLHRYAFYEVLADTTIALEDEAQIKVTLVPALTLEAA